ncbi:hypothetical protein [Pseudoalteromonas phage J2-1_QLiu-2017]|nr:hypothetical protein [Pseudoalteromonas phage J2-1_QLiu-2017]
MWVTTQVLFKPVDMVVVGASETLDQWKAKGFITIDTDGVVASVTPEEDVDNGAIDALEAFQDTDEVLVEAVWADMIRWCKRTHKYYAHPDT